MKKNLSVALIQLTSKLDPAENLEKIYSLLNNAKEEIKQRNPTALFLPECFYSYSNGLTATPYLVREGNEHYKKIQQLAQDFNVALLGGSVAYSQNQQEQKVKNRNLNFHANGQLISFYDKIHLFKVELEKESFGEKKIIDETLTYAAGNNVVTYEFESWNIGASICFDLRFPELYRLFQAKKIDLITIASAFTRPTGQAHWHTLVRARAIENQAFVVAANQWGKHSETQESFGHSLIVDPWGEIILDAKEGEGIFFAELEVEKLNLARKRLTLNRQMS